LSDMNGTATGRTTGKHKTKGRSFMDKAMESEIGREVGFQFARNRLLRSLTKLGTKMGGPKK